MTDIRFENLKKFAEIVERNRANSFCDGDKCEISAYRKKEEDNGKKRLYLLTKIEFAVLELIHRYFRFVRILNDEERDLLYMEYEDVDEEMLELFLKLKKIKYDKIPMPYFFNA